LEEVVHLILEDLGLHGADRRLEVVRGRNELRRRPGAPRCVRRSGVEAGELREQLRGGTRVHLRGRRLHLLQNRVLRRGGKERLEGRDSAVVEAEQRSRLARRGLFFVDSVVGLVGGGRGVAGAAAHHERGPHGDLGLGPFVPCCLRPCSPRPDLAHSLGAHAELRRDGLAVLHRATPQLPRARELRTHLEDFERPCGSQLPRVVPRLESRGVLRRRRAVRPCLVTRRRIALDLGCAAHHHERGMGK
ncbi:hypothetical protein T484DRAFT_1942836, partial [Baffinella frigidus]